MDPVRQILVREGITEARVSQQARQLRTQVCVVHGREALHQGQRVVHLLVQLLLQRPLLLRRERLVSQHVSEDTAWPAARLCIVEAVHLFEHFKSDTFEFGSQLLQNRLIRRLPRPSGRLLDGRDVL